MSVFSERILSLRKNKGVSQTIAAKEIGISPRAYQKYEYEESEPTLLVAARIADFYGVSLDYLTGRTDQEQRPISLCLDGIEKHLEGLNEEVQELKKQMQKTE